MNDPNSPLFGHLSLRFLVYNQMTIIITFVVLLTVKRDSINEAMAEILVHYRRLFLFQPFQLSTFFGSRKEPGGETEKHTMPSGSGERAPWRTRPRPHSSSSGVMWLIREGPWA